MFLPFMLIRRLWKSDSNSELNSFDRDTFITTVNCVGQVSVFRDQEVLHSNFRPVQCVSQNAIVPTRWDGEPCIVIAGYGEGAGVHLRHAVTLARVRTLPYKEGAYCVCINATGTKVFFGTQSGLFF